MVDYAGKYKINGDTIFLTYDKDTIGTGYAPIAYLINHDKKVLEELDFKGQILQRRENNNRWIQIIKNTLKGE